MSGNYIHDDAAYARGRDAAIKRNARQGKRARWFADDPTREALELRLRSAGYDKPGTFLAKMAESLNEWGSLTEKQEAAVRKVFAGWDTKQVERKALDATSQHVGTVGERITVTGVVQFVTGFDTQYGYTTITTLRDASGNLYVFKGVALSCAVPYAPTPEIEAIRNGRAFHSVKDAAKGDTVTVKGTIKAHNVYNGAKQTQLARPKVESIVSPQESVT
jgi:hypothetical protein